MELIVTPNRNGTFGLWKRHADPRGTSCTWVKVCDLTRGELATLASTAGNLLDAVYEDALADANARPDDYATASDRAGRHDPDPYHAVREHYHDLGGEG